MIARNRKHPLPPAVEKAWDALVRQVRLQTASAEFGERFKLTAHQAETKRRFHALRVAVYSARAAEEGEG